MLGTPIIDNDAHARTALASLVAAVRTTAQRGGGNDRWDNGYLAGFLRSLTLTNTIRPSTFLQASRILDALEERKRGKRRNILTDKRNRARCKKCKDIIESKHRHDFVTCTCGAVSVDGGKDYFKRVGNPEDIEEMNNTKKGGY